MPNHDLIPAKDTVFNDFITILYYQLNKYAVKWKIDATELSDSVTLLNAWNIYWGICINKNTITTVDTTNKNVAKAALIAYTRPIIQKWIYLNKNMVDTDIISCGLKPHSKKRIRAGKPDSVPSSGFSHGAGSSIKGTYSQPTGEAGASKRGRPKGVGSLQTAIFVGPVPPVDPEDYPKTVIATRSPYIIEFAPALSGQKAWFVSRWISTDHIPGDWNNPTSITIN